MLVLTGDDIRQAIDMRGAIDAVRAGFIALSTGRAIVPVRSVMNVPGGTQLYMPAFIEGEPYSTIKVVSVYPGNPERGLATVIGSVLVLDAQTGVPVALLDGSTLTALRTGAAGGLAADLLANRDADTLGVIGAGVQAWTQIEAVCAVRPIREIRVYDLRREQAENFAVLLRKRFDAEVIVAESAHDALYGASIITAATNSKTPVVHAADVAAGAHITGVGSFLHTMQEVAADVVTKARVVVDHRESAWAEAGDLIIPRDQGLFRESDVHAEIGEIAAGTATGRESREEITFFKSVGNAVQDAAVAGRVVAVALERGLGTEARLF